MLMLSIVALLSSATVHAADLHTYKLGRLASTVEACENQRTAIVAAFTKSGVQVFDSQCKLNGKRVDFTLTYVSGLPIDIISTIEGYPHLLKSGFSKEADCLSNLDLELKNFKDQTRLEPLVAYCSPKSYASIFPEFYVRIDALGQPMNRPFTFERMVMPRITAQLAELTKELESAKSARFTLSRVRFFNDLGGHSISLHYYAPARVCLGLEKLIEMEEKDACDKYGAALKAIVAQSSDAPLGVICGPWGRGYEAYVLGPKDRVNLRSNSAPQSFATLEACSAKKAELEQFYKNTLGRKILGSLCHLNKDQSATLSLIEERVAPKECY